MTCVLIVRTMDCYRYFLFVRQCVCCYGMRTYGWYGDLCVVLPILLTLVSLKRELSQKSSHVLFSPYFLTLVSLKRELSHGAL